MRKRSLKKKVSTSKLIWPSVPKLISHKPRADNMRRSLTRNVRRTKKRRSVLLVSQPTLPAETPTRCLEVKVLSSLDSELQETMTISKKVAVAAEEAEEVAEVEEAVVIATTEVHADRRVVVAAAEAVKSSKRMTSQPSEVVASARAATEVNVKGLDYSRAF